MAEEIINISGIKGKQQDVAVAAGGVHMADLEKYFDGKQKEIHSLIASVTSPTATYFSNVISTIQTADKKAQEWNEMIVESIFGLETISKSILDAEIGTQKILSSIAQSINKAASESVQAPQQPQVIAATNTTEYLDFITDAILEVSGDVKAGTKSNESWFELLTESSVDIASTIKTTTSSIDSWLGLITEQLIETDKKSSDASIYNNFTKQAYEVLHQFITQSYNQSYLKSAKLEDMFGGSKSSAPQKTSTTNVDIKGDFDIKSLSNFISNSTFYNPVIAKMFRTGFISVANSINDGLRIIGKSVKDVEPANVLAAGELLVKIGSLVATQQELGKDLSLFGKNVISFSKKESIWTRRNAKNFKESFEMVSIAITSGLKSIANIKVDKAALKMQDIIKFFTALQELLQGELRTAQGTSFSIGTLIKFSGAGTREFVDVFSPKSVAKFDKSLQMISVMLSTFFGNIDKMTLPDKEKVSLILSTMISASDSMQNIKDISTKKISSLNKSLIYLAVGFKSFLDEIEKVEMPKDNKIMTIMTVISVVSKALEKMKSIPNPEKTISSFIIGITSLYTAIGQIEIDPKSASNLQLIDDSVEYLTSISKKITDIQNPDIKINKFLSGLNNLINWIQSTQVSKSSIAKATQINDVVDIFIILSDKIGSIKNPKPAKKSIKAIESIIKTLAKLEKPAAKAQKVLPTIVSIVTTTTKAFDKLGTRTGKNIQSFAGGLMLMSVSIVMLSVLATPAKAANKTIHIITNSIAHAAKDLGDKKVTQASKNLKALAVGMATIGLAAVAFTLLSPAIMVACFGLRFLRKSMSSFGSGRSGRSIKKSTLAIASFALAIWAFGEIVNWKSMLKTSAAIGLLATSMYMFNGGQGTGILGKWGGIKGGNFKGDPTKAMMRGAAALALLALSVYAWQELPLGFDGILKTTVGIGLLAGATWAFAKIPAKADNNMIKIAVAVGIMAGAVWAWDKVNPSWELLAIMGVGLAGIAGASWIYGKVDKKAGVNMILLAVGVAALGGAVYVWSLAQPSWELLGMMGAAVGGIALASLLFNIVTPMSGVSMLLVAAGVAAFGGAMWIWNQAQPTWETIGMVAAVVGGGALMAMLYAIPIVPLGAASMLLVGTSMLAIVGSLAIAKNTGLTLADAENFTSVLWEICIGFAKVAVPAIPAAIGAALMLPVAASTVLVGGSLALLSVLPMPDTEKVTNFNSAIWDITIGFAKICIPAIPAAIGAVLFLPVGLGTVVAGGVLALISAIKIPDAQKITTTMSSIKMIVDGWNEIGLWGLMKSAAKAAIFAAVAPITLISAVVIRAISGLDINQAKVTNNTNALFGFIDTVSEKFNEIGSGKKADAIWRGASVVGKISGVVYDLSEAVMKIAALQYEEYEVKNGKKVLKSMNHLTEKDFEMVGVGIGKLLTAITDPLIKIGEANGKDVHFGAITVPGQNKVERGVKAISGIAGVFTPLAELVKSIAETGILKDKDANTLIDNLAKTTSKLTMAIGESASNVIKWVSQQEIADPEGLKTVFESIGKIYEPVSSIVQAISESGLMKEKDPDKWLWFSMTFGSIVDALGRNAATIVSFVKGKGGFWNSSDTNAEGIVQVLGSVGQIYEPVNNIVKTITDTGLLKETDSAKYTNFANVFEVIVGAIGRNATNIISFVDSVGGLFSSSDTNAGDIVKILNNVNQIYNPVSTILTSISKTGILTDKSENSARRLQQIFPVLVNAISSSVTKMLAFVEDNEDINSDAASRVMSNIPNMLNPVTTLIATIGATGILNDKNTKGFDRLTAIISTVLDTVTSSIRSILSNVNTKERIDDKAAAQVMGNMGNIIKPVSVLIASISKTGILDDDRVKGFGRLHTIVKTVLDSLTYSVKTILIATKEDVDGNSAARVMNNMTNVIKPVSSLIATISATGILSDENESGALKLQTIIPVITEAISSAVTYIMKMADDNKSFDMLGATKVMANMNNLIRPVSVLIATISKTGILDDSNTKGVDKLQSVMKTVVDSVVYMIEKIGGQNTGITLATTSLSVLFRTISTANPDALVSIREEIDAIHSKIIDESPWVKFGKNLATYSKITANIRKEIGRVDLRKLILLEKFARDLKEANLNGNIQDLIKEIRELINAIDEQNDNFETTYTQNNFGGNTVNNSDIVGDQSPDTGGSFNLATAPVGGDAPASTTNSNQAGISRIATELEKLTRIIREKR